MLLLIWNRLTRLGRQFTRLAERVVAGTHINPPPPRKPNTATRPSRAKPDETLPGHFRWLVNMIPETERITGDVFWLLNRSELHALIFEAPEVCKLLRPLCKMLGVEIPNAMLWPKPRPLPQPQEIPEPETEPEPPEPDDGSPPSLEPGEPPEFSPAWWRLHPPPWLEKPE